MWAAANISILGVSYGAYLVAFYSLNLAQALIAGLVGTVLSFLLVGFISLAGKKGSAPTLVLSRAAFGVVGNFIPTAVSWFALVGWEIVLVALATLAAEAMPRAPRHRVEQGHVPAVGKPARRLHRRDVDRHGGPRYRVGERRR